MDIKMHVTEPFRKESISCESNMPKLNVPAMIEPLLENYDTHVNNFIHFLRKKLDCQLVYLGPQDIQQHILDKTVYACSVYYRPKKYLKDVFPIMIGSRLDLAIRHQAAREFAKLPSVIPNPPFEKLDIARGFFLINGFVRHLPYLFTNDPTNTHVIQKNSVRVYSYNADDRGKELSYYVATLKNRQYGDVVIVHNDGSETTQDPHFFTHCPYPVHLTAYMSNVFQQDCFDIDHLGNKMFVSPGHIFTKLFIKYLYKPIRDQDWKLMKSKATLVRNSIELGNLLHVLSRKTVYFKESRSAGKMINEPRESSHREIGANGEVFVEKSMGCYREISTQTYPLNPFLLYMNVRQMSNKVNHATLEPYHPSQEGWFCKLGIFDTKNVGRTNTMVRGTVVTTCDTLDPVYHESHDQEFWSFLNIEPQEQDAVYFVVVNEACIPVTRACFYRINVLVLKHKFGKIECYERGKFIIIRYKAGLIMKRLPEVNVWVTPYDQLYWARYFFRVESMEEMIDRWPMYSYLSDLNPYFHHNAFLKNILAFNSLKNSVLATTCEYAWYFMDTISTYRHEPSSHHVVLMEPVNDRVSKHFALLLPQVMVTYMSFLGHTQEDCIVKREDFDGFDCFRFYTLRVKLKTASDTWIKFHPVRGDVDEDSDLLGTLISGKTLQVEPYSIHLRIVPVSDCEFRLYFSKRPFQVVQHFITQDKLTISVEQEHRCSTGDKLCTLHGQKGVIRVVKEVPLLDGHVSPILILNPYCLFRMTLGQIREAVMLGGGRDAVTVHNSQGKLIEGATAFYGETKYFVNVYFSSEHIYAPDDWVMDKVTSQPVKGRSRQGGMKIGNMESSAIRGQGIGNTFELKFHEHGDRVPVKGKPTESMPQSVKLVKHDLAHYKGNLQLVSKPTITPKAFF